MHAAAMTARSADSGSAASSREMVPRQRGLLALALVVLYGVCSACTFHNETNHHGHDLRHIAAVSSKEACCTLCSTAANCTVWVWRAQPPAAHDCFLKNGFAPFTQRGAWSGTVTGPPAPPPAPPPPAPPHVGVPIVSTLSSHSFAAEGGGSPVVVEGIGLSGGTAACRIVPQAGGFTYAAIHSNGAVVFAAVVFVQRDGTKALRCQPPPAVITPGPGLLSVRNSAGWSVGQPVDYVYLLDIAIGRRPYVAETQGELLCRCNASLVGHRASVTATLLSSSGMPTAARWHWPNVTLNASSILQFSLGSVPTGFVNSDLRVTVAFDRTELPANVTKYRRLVRAPSSSAVTEVQVDHSRRGILIGGQPYIGSGWYADGNSNWQHNLTAYLAVVTQQASVGDNLIMPYGLSRFNASEQQRFLDHCAQLGIKVIYPLAPLISARMAWDSVLPSATWQAQLVGNLSVVQNSSALLGYLVCDDCCSSREQTSLTAQLYNRLKELDPYRLLFGAVQCQNAWMWSDVASFLAPSNLQPRLQLGLDVVLYENYVQTPGDELQTAPVIRRGVAFEPIMNSHGLWATTASKDFPRSPSATRSALWLSVIEADLTQQLTFVLLANSWLAPGRTVDDGWLQTVAVAAWAQEARMLAASLNPAFGSQTASPLVTVINASVLLAPSSMGLGGAVGLAPQQQQQQQQVVRARGWHEDCTAATNSSGICMHIVVVNLVSNSPVAFSLAVFVPGYAQYEHHTGNPPYPVLASRLFGNGGYNVAVVCGGVNCTEGRLDDFVGAGETIVYEIGCHGPRLAEPPPHVNGLEFQSCADRRVT